MAGFWDDLKLQFKMGDVTTKLIFWNVGIFLLSIPFFYQFKFGYFEYPQWLFLSSDGARALTHPWTLITYAFLHATFFHLLFNMIILNFSGRMFLTFFTQKQLLGLYILAAIFAALAFIAGYAIMGSTSSMVGASGAIMAVLLAVATCSPEMPIRLMLIGNLKLWHFAAFIVILDLMFILVENTGGHIAHLAGAFFGFLYIKLLKSGTDLSKAVTSVTNLFSRGRSRQFKKVHKNYNPQPAKTVSRIVTKDKTQQQIDEILDKISRSGYDSLTKEEKDFLFRAGKQ
ncbi:MAG: rhomboid family intramembrane serine protease [Flavobacterium sp.]|nr:MAG: rhomboid family intramembrane serine protease [Flavobacterium sp.]